MIHGVHIGPQAVIANHATVLDGAVIGARSLVAAHQLVVGGTKIPDEVLVTGAPAKVRDRSPVRVRRRGSTPTPARTRTWPGATCPGWRRCRKTRPAYRRHRGVHLPVRAQRRQLALVVDPVGEHAFGGDLVPAHGGDDVADVGFLVAALTVSRKLNSILSVGAITLSQKADIASRPRCPLPSGSKRKARSGPRRWRPRRTPPARLVAGRYGVAGALACQVCRCVCHCCHPEWI